MKSRDMHDCNAAHLVQLLRDSKGFSRSVIVVLIDIRGFSNFSKHADSVEVAWFVSKAYTWLLTKHFPDAVFCKPTGDGLLLIVEYSEQTLKATADAVVQASLKAVSEFADALKGDLVVTYPVPSEIAISITRGTACEVRTDKRTVDYCGKILNLAARYLDLCRPRGVILDGTFRPLLSAARSKQFRDVTVFLRGIAESDGIVALTSKDVVLHSSCLFPIDDGTWESHELAQDTLKRLPTKGNFHHPLPEDYKPHTDCQLQIMFPSRESGRVQKDIAGLDQRSVSPTLSAGEWKLVIDYPQIANQLRMTRDLRDSDTIFVILKYRVASA